MHEKHKDALKTLKHNVFLNIKNLSFLLDKIKRIILRAINAYFVHRECKFIFLYAIIFQIMLVLCQDLVQVKMRNFSHFNPPEAQPQCVFFHTIVRIHLVTYSYNGYEFVSYCRKLPDIQKSTGMPAYNHGF